MILDNKKVHDLIVEKDTLVDEGRAITAEIEKLGKKVLILQEKEKVITGKVKPDPELKKEGDMLAEQIETIAKRLEEIGNEIHKQKMEAIPVDMMTEHKKLLKEIESLERNRDKKALKIQKVKNKLIPLIQKEVKPLLKEYDDIETAKVKNGQVIIETFNHLEEFKKKFKK